MEHESWELRERGPKFEVLNGGGSLEEQNSGTLNRDASALARQGKREQLEVSTGVCL